MRITLKCAWCGTQMSGIGEKSVEEPNISHGICPACHGKLLGAIPNRKAWDGVERRQVVDRRTRERRRSMIDEVDDLIVISRRTWIDGKRRVKVRRTADRVWLADRILHCPS